MLSTVMIGLVVIVMLAAQVSAVTTVSKPTGWDQGSKWAMGASWSYQEDFADKLDELVNQIENNGYVDIDVNKLNIEAEASCYVVNEVVENTSTTYVLSTKMAMKMAAEATIAVTAEVPKAGTYDSFDDIGAAYGTGNTEVKTIEVGIFEDFALLVEGTTVFDKDFAIKSTAWDCQVAFVTGFDGKNIPTPKVDETSEAIALSYKNYDIDLRAVLNATVDVTFTPALDIYDFPIVEGESWEVISTANVTGTVGGFFDITGLTDEIKELMAQSEYGSELETIEFPISFDDYTSEDGSIVDGEIVPFDTMIDQTLYCDQILNDVYVLGTPVDVCVITDESGAISLYYSPQKKFFTSVLASADSELVSDQVPDELSMFTSIFAGDSEEMEMEAVSASTATAEIAKIESYMTTVEDKAVAGASSNGLVDFFFKAPFLGLIMVVLSVIIVAVALVMVRRKRPL